MIDDEDEYPKGEAVKVERHDLETADDLDARDYPEGGPLPAIVRHIQDVYEEYRDSEYRRRKLDEIEEGRRRYRGERPPKNFPWPGCSNKSMLLEKIAIIYLEPRVLSQVVGDGDFIHVKPVGPEDQRYVKDMKWFLRWMTESSMQFRQALRPVVQDLLIDGTVDVIPIWEEKEVIRRRRESKLMMEAADGTAFPAPDGMDPEMAGSLEANGFRSYWEDDLVEEPKLEFKCRLETVPMQEAFFPDDGRNFSERPYMRFLYLTLRELEDMSEENGGPYKNIGAHLVTDPGRTTAEEADEDAGALGLSWSEYSQEVRLLECYVQWKGEWRIVTVALDAAWEVVRDQPMAEVYPHGRHPVHRLSIDRETKESMGQGITHLVRFCSKGVDDLLNLMIDAGVRDVADSGFLEEGTGGIPADSLVIELGKWRPLPTGTVPHYPPKNGVQSSHLIPFLQLLMSFFERLTSIMDAILPGNPGGARPAGADTYSGMALLNRESEIAHSFRGGNIRDDLAPLVKDCIELYAAFIPMDAKMRIFENNAWVFRPVSLGALRGDYDYEITVRDAAANPMMARREAIERYQMLAKNPVVNPVQTVLDLLDSYGIRDSSKHVNQEIAGVVAAMLQAPELAQVVKQHMAQKAAAAQKAEVETQAQRNVMRRDIQGQVEKKTGFEDRKLVDQVQESIKRKMITPDIERRMGYVPPTPAPSAPMGVARA